MIYREKFVSVFAPSAFIVGANDMISNVISTIAEKLKMRDWKMQEWKMREQIAGVENAGVIMRRNPSEEIP